MAGTRTWGDRQPFAAATVEQNVFGVVRNVGTTRPLASLQNRKFSDGGGLLLEGSRQLFPLGGEGGAQTAEVFEFGGGVLGVRG